MQDELVNELALPVRLKKDSALTLADRAEAIVRGKPSAVLSKQVLSTEFKKRGVSKKNILIQKGTERIGYAQQCEMWPSVVDQV